MDHREIQTAFTGSENRGLQVGYNTGNVETHHHYTAAGRPETSLTPSLFIPFGRDSDFVDRGTILDQIHERCDTPGSRTALVGLGGVGYVRSRHVFS